MAVASLPFGCATAFIAVLLGEKRKLERPSGLAATVAAAAPQKRRRSKPDIFFITSSLATAGRIRVCLQRLTTQAGSQQAAEVYLYCARVYQHDTLVSARTTAGVRAPIAGALIIN